MKLKLKHGAEGQVPPPKLTKITWTEQNILFGLDYSSKKGIYKDFSFDIRYDYDGIDPKIKPNHCECNLTIKFKGAQIYDRFGINIDDLTEASELYLQAFLEKYA